MTRETRERESPGGVHGVPGGGAWVHSVVGEACTGLDGTDGSVSVSSVLHLVGGRTICHARIRGGEVSKVIVGLRHPDGGYVGRTEGRASTDRGVLSIGTFGRLKSDYDISVAKEDVRLEQNRCRG